MCNKSKVKGDTFEYNILFKTFESKNIQTVINSLQPSIIAKSKSDENQYEMRFFEPRNTPIRKATEIWHAHNMKSPRMRQSSEGFLHSGTR